METIILAGGEGKRAQPLSLTRPKPMFRILGKPLLHYVIDTLKEADLKDFIIVTGKDGNIIKEYFGDGSQFGVNIRYTQQSNPLGMAHAIQTAKDLVSDNFLVVNGDDIFESSLIKEKIEMSKNSDAELLLSAKPVKETWKFGIIKTSDEGKVIRIIEKPDLGKEPSNLAVIGAYILPLKIFDYYEKVPLFNYQHETAIQKFINDGNTVKAITYNGVFLTFKYPWDLFEINQYLMEKHLIGQKIGEDAEVSEKAEIFGDVFIDKGVKVLEHAVIRGPCYIGKNSLIGNNVLIWNYSSIGANSVIGFSTEIKNSLIGDNCWFHTNYIGNSIVSDNCSFGSGAVTANFRFDEQTVKVNVNNQKIDSGRDKLGVIMADNCKVGVNATLLPGVKIGPNSIVGPNVCLRNVLEPNKIILMKKENYEIKKNNLNLTVNKKELRFKLKM